MNVIGDIETFETIEAMEDYYSSMVKWWFNQNPKFSALETGTARINYEASLWINGLTKISGDQQQNNTSIIKSKHQYEEITNLAIHCYYSFVSSFTTNGSDDNPNKKYEN